MKGRVSYGPNTNELLLKKAQRSSDRVKLVAVMANYTSKSSFFYCVPHLEGEEVFGSTK
jgi:hypothetical protein